MLSYHADMDIHTNPYELGLDRLIHLDDEIDFIGKDALLKVKIEGIKRKQVGLHLNSDPLPGPNTRFWGIKHSEVEVGKVTSAVYSPRLKKNIGLAMVLIEFSDMGQKLIVSTPDGDVEAMVVEKPFFDPKKKITSQN